MTENNLVKGFTRDGVRNYDPKWSSTLDYGVTWNFSSCGRFLVVRTAAPSAVYIKLAGLLSVVI